MRGDTRLAHKQQFNDNIMGNFKCNIIEQGIHIQGDALNANGEAYTASLLLSKEEISQDWDSSMKWAQERGGNLPTPIQGLFIADHFDKINKTLRDAGLQEIDRWQWTSEETLRDPCYVRVVGMSYGCVHDTGRCNAFAASAVSAFPPSLEV